MRTRVPSPVADDAFVVVPSDSALLVNQTASNPNAYPAVALYYGGAAAANISVYMACGSATTPVAVTFTNVQPGSTLPIAVKQVLSTGTTAAAGTIIALVGRMGFQ